MADDIKRVQVRIGSMTYSLVSAADEQYTRQIGARADEMIRRVLQSNPQLSQNMATVLALVNAVDDLSRIYDKMRHSDSRQQANDKKVSEMHLELQRLREQNWDMKKSMLELQTLCREYESELAQRRSDQGSRFAIESDLPDERAEAGTLSPEAFEAAADTAMPGKISLAPESQSEQDPIQPAAEENQSDPASGSGQQTEPAQPEQEPADTENAEQRPLIQTHFDDFLMPRQPTEDAGDSKTAPRQNDSSSDE